MHRLACFLVVAAALAGGCDCSGGLAPPPPPPGVEPDAGAVDECDDDDDCPLGQACREGDCVDATPDLGDDGCVDDTECDDGFLCAQSTGRCISDAPVPGVPTGPPGPCADGDERTCGVKVGTCDYGVERCEGGVWSGVCLGAIPPADELCDGLDNDCDTDTDEDFTAGGACFDGLGFCRREGVLVCTADGLSTTCTAQGLDPTGRVELCGNDPDDDCDGDIEEGFEARDTACALGAPPCEEPGTFQCSLDERSLECVVTNAGGEVCDDVDNDGDGCTDEGFNVDAPCTEGVGPCARSGLTICAPDRASVICDAVPAPAGVETCNNVDDDCNTVIDDGCDDDDDNFCDAVVGFTAPTPVCPNTTSAANQDCNDTNPNIRPGVAEICNNGTDENCNGALNDGCQACNANIDADFDGSNQCNDCDETNGAVFPGATERCDGLDQNCNGEIDETFDIDDDGFTTCGSLPGGGIDPARADCNDNNSAIFPGACELCRLDGTNVCGGNNNAGSGVDEDCDGFIDELCFPCDPIDRDGDGASECEGDCAPADRTVRAGIPEVCDGKDTDCNVFTVDNCDVSDPCNFDLDNNPATPEPDECKERLICVESLNASGSGTGNFTCTSLCNTTSPGLGLGDSCDVDETCSVALTPTANLHGCQVNPVFGARAVGQSCGANSDCRSGDCERDQRFAGPPGVRFCQDACGNDADCGNGTFCQAGFGITQCWVLRSFMTRGYLDDCSGANQQFECIAGPDSCVDVNGTERCLQVCCTNADCESGSYCSLKGQTNPSVIGPGAIDTAPMCFPESAGNGGRPAGAACDDSNDCASEFCDVALGVCVDICCNDATCPNGLLCETAPVTLSAGVTFARVCLNVTLVDGQTLEAR